MEMKQLGFRAFQMIDDVHTHGEFRQNLWNSGRWSDRKNSERAERQFKETSLSYLDSNCPKEILMTSSMGR